ncbi:hypothetical protein WJR50_21760 [Catalinimonas sp. 4WD22]|uniref:hypothetical protein n=1 Tax=Catalinimonas locisalis TaxID=3133978 RepID=UPI0031017B94
MKYPSASKQIFILAISSTMFFLACSQENDIVNPEVEVNETEVAQYPEVDEALHTYFSRFEHEARQRGLSYDLNTLKITGVIKEIDEEHVAGQCAYNRFTSPRQITLDKSFWESSSDLLKEFIVFHELGHCVLNRSHLETSFSNGVCSSMMRSGNGDCFDYYSRSTRSYYIDELFEIESPQPF